MKYNSRLALVISNLAPLFGVLFFDWNLFTIMFVYWFENIIIGFFTILKILKAEVEDKDEFKLRINNKPVEGIGRLENAGFFLLHFGLFTAAHGILVYKLFYDNLASFLDISLTALLLFISHGISYYVNFISKEEYKKTSPSKVMFQPYKRVLIIHVTTLIAAQLLGALKIAIVILVFLKIIDDIISHSIEHKFINLKGENNQTSTN